MTHDMVAIVAAAATTGRSSSGSPAAATPTSKAVGTATSNSIMRQQQCAKPLLGIGSQGQLPWRLAADLQHFRRVTVGGDDDGDISSGEKKKKKKNAVIMGRKTWESIPQKFRPLKGRINVVLTRQSSDEFKVEADGCGDVLVASSLQDASAKLESWANDRQGGSSCSNDGGEEVGTVFVIGGEQVYRDAIEGGYVKRVLFTEVTNVPGDVEFDAFFPSLDLDEWTEQLYYDENPQQQQQQEGGDKENHTGEQKKPEKEEGKKAAESVAEVVGAPSNEGVDAKTGIAYRFLQYTKRNVEELQYLNLCREIMTRGIQRGDRTGTGTLSKFGAQLRFDLRDGRLPLLTTKRTFWRGVAEELLWFISGNTDANALAEKNIHIWDGNGSREFLDSRGLGHREVGDLGPVYGFQWRHFGASYVDFRTDYTGQGVDQLADCIDKIKNNPEDRRIIMSAWNPAALDEMALPPCHMFCQFYVDTVNNELSCQMYQRSADMGLGVPFNIASYALLTHLVAHVTGLKPGEFVHTIGDAHIYLNHVEALKQQLQREPRDFPTLKINPAKTDIDDFVYDDLEVIGYNPHKMIKMKMAV